MLSVEFRSNPSVNWRCITRTVSSIRITGLTVYDAIVVELKAISDLNSEHEAQLFNYLRIARQQVGYLLNFGQRDGLQWKRFILTDLHSHRPAREH
ncbi:MAG: GxxExxY protein [Planctomycetaceae bacterium]|nr:GxxExxY protein [Planctomycetaceae bacterium]